MKKIFFASAFVLAGLAFTSCSSDDDSSNNNNNNNNQGNPLVGVWTADKLSYTIPNGPTNTHDFSATTGGCAVDVIELKSDKSADLKVESKVGENCEANHHLGSWTDNVITLDGINQKDVVSVSENELVLKYVMTFGGQTTEVTVNYTK